jgi:hypothetical protein
VTLAVTASGYTGDVSSLRASRGSARRNGMNVKTEIKAGGYVWGRGFGY